MSDTLKFDPRKLTPTFLKQLFSTEIELIEKHQRTAELLYEMMASFAFHAPLMRPCEVKSFTTRGLAIVQPTHWLVYHFEDRNRVRAHAGGTMTEPSVPPNPVGYMILTRRTRPTKTWVDQSETEPTYIALCGKMYLGEWGAARCITEIVSRQ